MMIANPRTLRGREERMNPELGKLVGEVSKEMGSIGEFLDDPITRQSSCGGELLPLYSKHVMERIETLLRNAGYNFFKDFIDEVEARTNEKWAYFYSGIAHFED